MTLCQDVTSFATYEFMGMCMNGIIIINISHGPTINRYDFLTSAWSSEWLEANKAVICKPAKPNCRKLVIQMLKTTSTSGHIETWTEAHTLTKKRIRNGSLHWHAGELELVLCYKQW